MFLTHLGCNRSKRDWARGRVIFHRETALDPKIILRGCRDLEELEKSPSSKEEPHRIWGKNGGRKSIRSQDSTFLIFYSF